MDLQYARETFERYLEQYDQSDDNMPPIFLGGMCGWDLARRI